MALLTAAMLVAPSAPGQFLWFGRTNLSVGDVPMPSRNTLLQDITASPVHTRLLNAIKMSGMEGQLQGSGASITLLAPTDDDFAKLPKQRLNDLMQPGNPQLRRMVLSLMLPGKLSYKALSKQVKHGHGMALIKTLDGSVLKATMDGTMLILTDPEGNTATVITSNIYCKGGILHVTDAVLMPE